jgi:tRNA U34 5-carboxymethylaminomethyl modifying GTPase MnmE/TrmE
MNRLIGSKDTFLSVANGSAVGQSAIEDIGVERAWRDKKGEDIKAYLAAQDSLLDKFDEDVFRRTVEKVKVRSMVAIVFVFKAGVEIMEVL